MESFTDDLAAAKANVVEMIEDSDLHIMTPSYSKGFPKKCKLSPDGWFQVHNNYCMTIDISVRSVD